MTKAKRAAARRPAPRTVTIILPRTTRSGRLIGEAYAGWEAECRVDFPAAWITGLDSGDLPTVLDVLGRIIVSHNLPNADDELAATLADVDPFDGLRAISDALGDAIGSLPPR